MKKFCLNFMQVKYGQILIKILSLLNKLWKILWGTLKEILQNVDEIFRKVERRLEAI